MNPTLWFLVVFLATLFFSALSAVFALILRMDPQMLEDRRKTIAEKTAEQWPREWALNLVLLPFFGMTATFLAGLYCFGGASAGLGRGLLLWLGLTLGILLSVTLLRSLAERHPMTLVRFLGWIYLPFFIVFFPLSSLLRLFLGRFGMTAGLELASPLVSTREIQDFVDSGAGSELLEAGEREMISSIIDFHDTQVREVMIPRPDVKALDVEISVAEALKFVSNCGHSRIPVYSESMDNIVGLLYTKDLLLLTDEEGGKARLKEILREPYFIPETKLIGDLLRRFQEQRQHLAIVVDEYGGTEGIVTLEDLIEEIVGEIRDEYDQDESLFEIIDENSARVDAKIDLEELGEILGTEFEEGEGFESLGGLLLLHAGSILRPGEEVELSPYIFRVESVQRQRIAKIILIRPGLASLVASIQQSHGAEEEN